MNWPLAVAGIMSLGAAAFHGIAGDVLILQKLRREGLPATVLGGPESSRRMMRASWHLVTITFAASGLALIFAGMQSASVFAPGVVRLLGLLYSGFALLILPGAVLPPKPMLLRHPAPLGLSAIAVLIWVGASGLAK
jgi:hypothetical protein